MRYALGLSAIGFGATLVYAGISNVPITDILRSVFSGNAPQLPNVRDVNAARTFNDWVSGNVSDTADRIADGVREADRQNRADRTNRQRGSADVQ